MTLREVLVVGIERLEQSHIPAPRLTAEVLLAHCLERERPFLHAHAEDVIEEQAFQSYQEMLSRRASREPLQYITETQEFYGRPFSVNPSVLIPRPETEHLVDTVREKNSWTSPRIVDVGTGSGCIGITLALEIAGAEVTVTDIDMEALKVAKGNATKLGAGVSFACMDLLGAFNGPFEFVVSNPPYVLNEEKAGLQPEVRDHEPGLALCSNGNPIELYRRLIDEAVTSIVDGGYLVFEIGYSMESAVQKEFSREWEVNPSVRDLKGIPRAIFARKRG